MQASYWLAVAAGGAVGALLRAGIYELFVLSRNPHLHPLPTLTVNILGSLVIGVAWYLLVEKGGLSEGWKIFIVTGLLGALTTFSTFSLDILRLLQAGQIPQAVSYVLASVLLCLLMTWLGYQAARWITG